MVYFRTAWLFSPGMHSSRVNPRKTSASEGTLLLSHAGAFPLLLSCYVCDIYIFQLSLCLLLWNSNLCYDIYIMLLLYFRPVTEKKTPPLQKPSICSGPRRFPFVLIILFSETSISNGLALRSRFIADSFSHEKDLIWLRIFWPCWVKFGKCVVKQRHIFVSPLELSIVNHYFRLGDYIFKHVKRFTIELLPISLQKRSGCLAALWKLMLISLLEFRSKNRYLSKVERERPVFCPVFMMPSKRRSRRRKKVGESVHMQVPCPDALPHTAKPSRKHM